MKLIVPVIGMHRSGTSAVTRCLILHGLNPGPMLRLRTPWAGSDNPTGYWEHEGARELHDGIGPWQRRTLPGPPTPEQVARAGQILRDLFSPAVWKDPRACLHFRMWQEAAEANRVELRPVLVSRPLSEIAASLLARNGSEMVEVIENYLAGQAQWAALRHSWVTLRDLWLPETYQRLQDELGVNFPKPAASVMPRIEAFLDRSLVHHGPG